MCVRRNTDASSNASHDGERGLSCPEQTHTRYKSTHQHGAFPTPAHATTSPLPLPAAALRMGFDISAVGSSKFDTTDMSLPDSHERKIFIVSWSCQTTPSWSLLDTLKKYFLVVE